MSFLGRIFYGFYFLVSIGLGAPLGLFLILQIFVLLTLLFSFLFSWYVLPWTDFLRFLIF